MIKRRLIVVFLTILIVILAANYWASVQLPVWKTPMSVTRHPWFIATFIDCYLAFFTFWLWVAYKETSLWVKLIWLVLIFGLGNIAMAGYVLIKLWTLPADMPIEALLLRRPASRR